MSKAGIVELTSVSLQTTLAPSFTRPSCPSTVRIIFLHFSSSFFSSHQSTPKSLKNGISSEFCNILTHICVTFFQVIPVIAPFAFSEEELNLDESVSAVCSITKGDLPIKIWWTFKSDNELEFPYNLTTGDGVMITKPNAKNSFLSIENVKSRHRGTYECQATNAAGVSVHSAFLSINGSILNFYILILIIVISMKPKSNEVFEEFCNLFFTPKFLRVFFISSSKFYRKSCRSRLAMKS
jgi:hypothetical protein